jgi:predicted dehydrogenase/threonine dehydrogenase-like Zn-dependent dehydrogenase
MKQVLQKPRGSKPYVAEIPIPQCGAGELLVSTRASLISAGTEKMLIDFAGKSLAGKAKERPDLAKKVLNKLKRDGVLPTVRSVLAQLESPLPLGYSAAGEVLEVGATLQGKFQKGDRVALAGAGLANHAEVNAVPANLVVPLPEQVSFREGCFATLGAIALHGVHNARLTVGDRVLVIGLGLVGQLAAQLARVAGAQVMGVDYDPDRLSLARELSCTQTHNLGEKGTDTAVETFTGGRGFDAILICAATKSNDPIENAAGWARDRARVVLVGKVGTELPYAAFMKKELEVVISRSYGPGRYDPAFEQKGQVYPVGFVPHTERDNLSHVVQLIAQGRLNVERLTSHDFDISEADQAYTLVTGKVPCLGVVLTYPEGESQQPSRLPLRPITVADDTVGLAVIGAGHFATSVLLPAAARQSHTVLTGICSKGGTSAQAAGDRFGFGFVTSKAADLYADDKTHAILIATRHNSHAELTCQALEAGKHVFVEKPLALNMKELAAVEKAYKKRNNVLLVGFNRRFAPHTQALLHRLPASGPRQVLIRVNAGRLPQENWQSDPQVGGGRLLGEVCHFTDLALALVEAAPAYIYATAGQGQDNYHITISFTNGSTAQIFYTSDGDTSISKERVEVYTGGAVGIIDNFTSATLTQGGKTKKLGHHNLLTGQDKGHQAGLKAFLRACRGEISSPIPPQTLFLSSALPLLAQQSIQTGQPVKL